jgi:dipeptidyl aminopeptidase/acylaminoacyl peptidase
MSATSTVKRLPAAAAGVLLLLALAPLARAAGWASLAGTALAARQLPLPVIPPDTTHLGKRILTIDEYGLWRSIGSASLSPDGRWVTYAFSRREVDDSLFIRPLAGGEARVVVRGANPAFSADSRWVAYFVNPPQAAGARGAAAPAGAPGGTSPAGARGAAGGASGPRAVELLSLETRDTVRWENVQTFAFAAEGRALVVKKRATDTDARHRGTDLLVRYLSDGTEELLPYVNEWALDARGARLAWTVDGPDGEQNGIHLLDLASRSRRVLDAERKAAYARLTWGSDKRKPSADALAVLKGTKDEKVVEIDNALLLWPALSRNPVPAVLDPRPVRPDTAAVRDTLAARDSAVAGAAPAAARAGATPAAAMPQAKPTARIPDPFPAGWVLSEKGTLRWAPDASRLFVATRYQQPAPNTLCRPAPAATGGRDRAPGAGGAAPAGGDTAAGTAGGNRPAPGPRIVRMATRVDSTGRPLGPEEVQDGTCPEFVADVDIWHVQDRELQSVQMIRASRDRNQTFMGVVHLEPAGGSRGPGAAPRATAGQSGARGAPPALTPRFVQLADSTMATVEVSANGRFAMGKDGRSYASDWEPSYADLYRVDLSTGERTKVMEKHRRTLGFSPRGDHYLYWKDGHAWSYALATGRHANLTQDAPVSFVDEEFDNLGEKPPLGIAGWAADSTGVILEARYDLWLQPLGGGRATNLTRGLGAEREMQLRILDLDPEEELVDLRKPLTLTAYGQWTKQAGFFRLQGNRLSELVLADARFGRVQKADSANVLLYTREDFRTFPDYLTSGLDFTDPVKVTDANPQQAEYNWGRNVLFDYWTSDSVHLQGILSIPDDYVPGQKRPMLVDFYEKMSQGLHAYPTPIYRDTPMVAGYVSAGYLFLRPDIRFNLGATHSQMLECINLAIDEVEKMGYLDPERIGLHGHSFSGQGSAYIATHSDRFAAIVPGAAATNLVSDFNQLWKSSGTNQHGYDTYGQGRFGTNPYDDRELFLDQSATPNAVHMNTPLLILHGTADGSVEWLQAIEFFNGLRWFGKNVILASYPDEPHHLTRYENQKDFQIRMRQFYDHYLWDRPAPRWMTDGRPFLKKERDRAMIPAQGGGSGAARPGGGG